MSQVFSGHRTSLQSLSKAMVTFRKASKKRGAIRSNTAEEEEDDNENDSALDTIQLTQKKQRLVQGTLYKRARNAR